MYIGDANSDAVLTPLYNQREDGIFLKNPTPSNFEPAINGSIQSDWVTVALNLTFLTIDANVMKISNGQSLSDSNPYGPTTFNQYTLLFIHPNNNSLLNIYIPVCEVDVENIFNWQKTDASKSPIVFKWKVRNRFATVTAPDASLGAFPVNPNTAAFLKANYLGSRSPI